MLSLLFVIVLLWGAYRYQIAVGVFLLLIVFGSFLSALAALMFIAVVGEMIYQFYQDAVNKFRKKKS